MKRPQQSSGNPELFVSVNFSAQDFDDPAFPDEILRATLAAEIDPGAIHIELTERLLLRQSEQVKLILNRCRDIGIEIAVDDFGIGYSSLSYLHQYPVTTLKIDQSFIRNMITDSSSPSLVNTIISLSENMGFETIAEGVETHERAQLLASLKSQVAQGHYYARPMSKSAMVQLLGKTGHA